MAGFGEETSIWLTAVTAAAQSLGVLVGLHFIDACGRRPLVLSSLGMVSAVVCRVPDTGIEDTTAVP